MNAWQYPTTDYPAVRRVMGPMRDRLSDPSLERLLTTVFPAVEPEYVEDFMRTLQKFGRQAAPIAQRVAPGVAQGALQGGMVAGPWGALAGAVGGGAATLLRGGGAQRPPATGPAPGMPAGAAAIPGAIATAVAPALAGPPGAAPAQLLALLSRPETMQALLALTMGQAGRSTIPVGQRQIPAQAFANAIAELATETAVNATSTLPPDNQYWFNAHGAPRADIANPTARAALLLGDLAEADWEEGEWDDDETDEFSLQDDSFDEEADALAAFESALTGESSDDD